jgi:oxygen-independent coproporphyrinogen-3 oxidase
VLLDDLRKDPLAYSPGVYVHIPFCAAVCSYCAFSVEVFRNGSSSAYIEALTQELRSRLSEIDSNVKSLYIGGGTPSILEPSELYKVVEVLHGTQLVEFTLEANPESITKAKLKSYKEMGVSRISLGVQSFDDKVLKFFGRSHSVLQAIEAIDAVAEFGLELSLDIIYGSGAEDEGSFDLTVSALREVADRLDHVSCYALTLEPRTRLHHRYRHTLVKDQVVKEEDVLASRYYRLEEELLELGFYNYEISNWAKADKECRHNMNYWMRGEYLGVGSSAHSFIGSVRAANEFSPKRYVETIHNVGSAITSMEHLSSEQERIEKILLGIRCSVGVERSIAGEIPSSLEALVEETDGFFTLTRDGRMLADMVALKLISNK